MDLTGRETRVGRHLSGTNRRWLQTFSILPERCGPPDMAMPSRGTNEPEVCPIERRPKAERAVLPLDLPLQGEDGITRPLRVNRGTSGKTPAKC
jgi:hypothetical protein